CRRGRMRESRSRDHLLDSEDARSGASNRRASGSTLALLALVALLAPGEDEVELSPLRRARHPRIGGSARRHRPHRDRRCRARVTLVALRARVALVALLAVRDIDPPRCFAVREGEADLSRTVLLGVDNRRALH